MSPQDVADIMLALSTFYPLLPNSVLASKVGMQDLQEGLVPPDHCRHTIGRKGEFFLLLALPVSKQGKEEKGKCDLFQTVPAENPNLNALKNKLLS